MASLRDIVRENQREIINGIPWVVIYKQGRSWGISLLYHEDGNYEEGYTFDRHYLEEMVEISKVDPKAICINGNFVGFGEDFTLAEIENKIRWFYETRRHQLVGDFMDGWVCNLDDIETPDSEELAGTYIREYEGTMVTVMDTEEFVMGQLGRGDFYNPLVYSLSDGTYWFSDSNETVEILESLAGAELAWDGNDGWVVKTRRGTRPIKWAD